MRNIKMYRCTTKKTEKIVTYNLNESEIKLLCHLINEKYEYVMKKHNPDMKLIDDLNKILDKLVKGYI